MKSVYAPEIRFGTINKRLGIRELYTQAAKAFDIGMDGYEAVRLSAPEAEYSGLQDNRPVVAIGPEIDGKHTRTLTVSLGDYGYESKKRLPAFHGVCAVQFAVELEWLIDGQIERIIEQK